MEWAWFILNLKFVSLSQLGQGKAFGNETQVFAALLGQQTEREASIHKEVHSGRAVLVLHIQQDDSNRLDFPAIGKGCCNPKSPDVSLLESHFLDHFVRDCADGASGIGQCKNLKIF